MQYKKTTAILLAVLAAAFYAVNVPVSKLLLKEISPTFLASLLYFGAGIGIGLLYCINPKATAARKTDTQRPALYPRHDLAGYCRTDSADAGAGKVHLPPMPLCWETLKSLPLR